MNLRILSNLLVCSCAAVKPNQSTQDISSHGRLKVPEINDSCNTKMELLFSILEILPGTFFIV